MARTIEAQRITMLSPAFGLYRGSPGATLDLEVGFVTDRAVQPEAGVVVGSLPGGRVARLTHFGSFEGLGASWERLLSWMQARGLSAGRGEGAMLMTCGSTSGGREGRTFPSDRLLVIW
ncbi:GyrI-like domain-containing protein, partial [Streptomyces muensis]